jgi:hypothetical protein
MLDLIKCDDQFRQLLTTFIVKCQSDTVVDRTPCTYECDQGFPIRQNADNTTMSLTNATVSDVVSASNGRVPARDCVSYSGPATASLAVIVHYPPAKTKHPSFGFTMDPDNCCMRLIAMKTGNHPDIFVRNVHLARCQRPIPALGADVRSEDYLRPYLSQHGKKVHDASRRGLERALSVISAKVVITCGVVPYNFIKETIRNLKQFSVYDFQLFDNDCHMFAQVDMSGESPEIVRLFMPMYHPGMLIGLCLSS